MVKWWEWLNGGNGGRNGRMAEMATYVLFTVHTDDINTDSDDDDDDDDTLIFYSIEYSWIIRCHVKITSGIAKLVIFSKFIFVPCSQCINDP